MLVVVAEVNIVLEVYQEVLVDWVVVVMEIMRMILFNPIKMQ